MSESRLAVMPLAEVVVLDAAPPFSASCDSVTKSSCAPERLPPCRSLASWFRSVRNWLAVEGVLAICDKRLLVIPLVAKGKLLREWGAPYPPQGSHRRRPEEL